MAGVGGGAGLALAKAFTLRGDPTGGLLPVFFVSSAQLGTGFALALGMGLLAALLPAVAAMRLRVVDALGRV
jgi:ABC-type antimicrobial peptide transport system permease subunit